MKILGIDDNEDLLNLCEIALTNGGHEYTGISNGREGLQAIKDEKFDIVLLDLSMPEFSGEDVMKGLIEDDILDKQKIVLFTALSANDKSTMKILEKAHSILNKPVDADMLIAHVQKIALELSA